MPYQSPPAPVLAPLLLVSPPWLSSRFEVKMMGLAAVPWALSVPLIIKPWLPAPLMIWPGAIVSVSPEGTVTLPASQ